MPRSNAESRGGLSRSAAKAVRGARRSHDDELISSLLGERAQHFKDHPLDGPDIISAMPATGPGGTMPQYKFISHETPGRPARKRSAPKSSPSLADAIEEAVVALDVGAVMGSPDIALSGLPGQSYEEILDEVDRPPNTY